MSLANYTARLISPACKIVTALPEILSKGLGCQRNFLLEQGSNSVSEVQCRRIFHFTEVKNTSVQSGIWYQNTESLSEHGAVCINPAESNWKHAQYLNTNIFSCFMEGQKTNSLAFASYEKEFSCETSVPCSNLMFLSYTTDFYWSHWIFLDSLVSLLPFCSIQSVYSLCIVFVEGIFCFKLKWPCKPLCIIILFYPKLFFNTKLFNSNVDSPKENFIYFF